MGTFTSLLIAINLFVFSHAFQSTQSIHFQTKAIRIKLNARPQTSSKYVHTNILTRRTINNFESTLPSNWEGALQKAIESAMHAPNHKRTEPWRFYLLGPEAIDKVCKLNADMISSKKGVDAGEAKYQRWKDMPGWLVVTCCKSEDDDMNSPTSLAREDYAACCCAVQNICLSLHAQGMGTKWTTGAVNFEEGFAEAIGFDYSEEYTVGTIWFGNPVDEPATPGKKFGFDKVYIKTD